MVGADAQQADIGSIEYKRNWLNSHREEPTTEYEDPATKISVAQSQQEEEAPPGH